MRWKPADNVLPRSCGLAPEFQTMGRSRESKTTRGHHAKPASLTSFPSWLAFPAFEAPVAQLDRVYDFGS